MAGPEPGRPDDLARLLRHWLHEANANYESLPRDVEPAEWVVRNFIASWQGPVRTTIEIIEECLGTALELATTEESRVEISSILQLVKGRLREELGL